ncbi:hypothetical protein GCM10023232_02790 [Sphingosinicella ginsenosidimutans]|uniref:DUF2292 domain-containing protein n=1 Tax=Allosphingosinicella ginsenosidimutans TaxID=1176539 RepID=A0A5C6TUN2_9SPHN|nr:YezD family protein [Sphingosinicella ginsenosidimutans]TXC64164.1 DUF2292 domain-containing protein [Sphingosinicella ginsenosidimutans]
MTDPRPLRLPRIARSEEVLAAIREQLARIHFGSIALTIHDGQVVQLDVTEKRRLFAR